MNPRAFTLKKSTLLGLAAAGILATTVTAHAQSGSDPAAPAYGGSASGATESSGASAAPMESSGASSMGAGASAGTTQGADSKVAEQDRELMREIAQANLAEIATGGLAQTRAQSEEVKNFAQKMVDDHSKAQEELVLLAQDKGVDLPQELDAKHQATLKEMEGLKGQQFDAAYLEQVGVKDHRQTHSKLESGMKKAQDPELQAYIEKTEPVIAEHLKMAQTMTEKQSSDSSVGASGAAGTGGAGNGNLGEADKDAGKTGVMGPGAEKH